MCQESRAGSIALENHMQRNKIRRKINDSNEFDTQNTTDSLQTYLKSLECKWVTMPTFFNLIMNVTSDARAWTSIITLCTLLWSIHFFQIGWIILFEKFLNRNSENVDPQIFVEEISKLIALYSWDNFFDFSFRFEAQLMPFEIPKFLQQKSRVICLSNKNPFSFQNFNQLE